MQIKYITALPILFAGLLNSLELHAQTFTSIVTPPISGVTLGVDANGTFLSTGPLSYGVTFDSTESAVTSPFFMWMPSAGALSVGYTDSGTGLSASNIGDFSAAFGYDSSAAGWGSVAAGTYSWATGGGAVAMGQSWAKGDYSTSLGNCLAFGEYGVALGGGPSFEYYNYGVAIGYANDSNIEYGVALGNNLIVNSYGATALGAYNLGMGGSGDGNWGPNDALLEVGNGTSAARSDALIIYKGGNAQLQGSLRCSPGGDLAMGSFTTGANPALGHP
jgi:hypothetical protein